MSAYPDIDAVLRGDASFAVVCGERDEVLAAMGDAAVDVTITDAPYDEHTHANVRTTRGNWKKGGREGRGEMLDIDLGFAPCDPATTAPVMLRVTRRWCVTFCALEQLGDWKRAATGAGYTYVRGGVWDRVAPTPSLHGDRPACRVEGIAIMHARGKLHWNGGGGFAFWSHLRLASAHGHDRTGHPTEKPLGLMVDLVRQFSDRGEVVCDPHAGSGTTGVAALQEGRRVILVERDPRWCDVARARCAAAVEGREWRKPEQPSLFGGAR